MWTSLIHSIKMVFSPDHIVELNIIENSPEWHLLEMYKPAVWSSHLKQFKYIVLPLVNDVI